MQVWLGADGRLRGVVSLDAVTTDEFRALSGAGGDPNERQGWRSGRCGLTQRSSPAWSPARMARVGIRV